MKRLVVRPSKKRRIAKRQLKRVMNQLMIVERRAPDRHDRWTIQVFMDKFNEFNARLKSRPHSEAEAHALAVELGMPLAPSTDPKAK